MEEGSRTLRARELGGVEMLAKRARMIEVGGWAGREENGVEEQGVTKEKGNEMGELLGRADCTQLARHA